MLLWFYLSGLVLLVGAEFNSEVEHASPYGKAEGEKVAHSPWRDAASA
jgi:membrane protein